MFYVMARRKATPSLAETLSGNIRQAREAREALDRGEWTQARVAERMKELGFLSWTRTTVAEVEGTGRGRQVSIEEWLGLSEVFGVAAFELLVPQGSDSTEVAIAKNFSTESHTELFARIANAEMLSKVTDKAFELAWQMAIRSVGTKSAARMRRMAADYQEAAEKALSDAEKLETDLAGFYALNAAEEAAKEAQKGRKR